MRALLAKSRAPWLCALLVIVTTGCTSTGSGTGGSDSGDVQANFTWKQSEATSGTRTARVSGKNGSEETYQGSSIKSRAIPR
jgi:hypothetical protein